MKGVTATRCFSLFFIISKKMQKTSCINEQDLFENSEFKRFCNDSTALSEKKLILAISFLQQGT